MDFQPTLFCKESDNIFEFLSGRATDVVRHGVSSPSLFRHVSTSPLKIMHDTCRPHGSQYRRGEDERAKEKITARSETVMWRPLVEKRIYRRVSAWRFLRVSSIWMIELFFFLPQYQRHSHKHDSPHRKRTIYKDK